MALEQWNRMENNGPPPFPEDFGERLEALQRMTGLSWGGFARSIGVTQTGLRKWRRGGPPSGTYFWAIIEFARGVPGGFELMLHGRASNGGGVED